MLISTSFIKFQIVTVGLTNAMEVDLKIPFKIAFQYAPLHFTHKLRHPPHNQRVVSEVSHIYFRI